MLRSILVFAFFLALAGCVTEIDLSGDVDGLDRLVVDGSFTDHAGAHQLRLLRPNRYGVSQFEDIRDASVRIVDDLGQSATYQPVLDLSDPSGALRFFYEIPAGVFPGKQGRAYHLEINLADGREYRSERQAMPDRIKVDSLVITGQRVTRTGSQGALFEQNTAFVRAAFTTPLQGDHWLRYEGESVGFFEELSPQGPFEPQRECYLTEKFTTQRIVTQAVPNANGKPGQTLVGTKDVDFHFEKSIYFTVIQRSIPQKAFEFWEKAALIANPQGTVFDPPPGALRGNITCVSNPEEVPLGYFEVAAIDTFRRKIFNGTLGEDFRVSPYCFYQDFVANRVECKDCILLKNSSYTKPHYWQ
jgi:hypothetical protein